MNEFEQAATFLLGVTRPVCFDNETNEWRYSTNGSAVVLRTNGKLFAVTAEHVVRGYKHRQILFPYVPGSEFFLPLEHVFEVRTPITNDTDHKDIRIFSVWEKKLNKKQFPIEAAFSLSANLAQERNETTKYFIAGYPNDLNSANYETLKLVHQGLIINLTLEHENRYLGVDQFRFSNTGELSTFQGFSGGGVFSITPSAPGRGNVRFEGILVRATLESMLGLAIRADFIANYINGIAKPIET